MIQYEDLSVIKQKNFSVWKIFDRWPKVSNFLYKKYTLLDSSHA
jgi:hypothetical protein